MNFFYIALPSETNIYDEFEKSSNIRNCPIMLYKISIFKRDSQLNEQTNEVKIKVAKEFIFQRDNFNLELFHAGKNCNIGTLKLY